MTCHNRKTIVLPPDWTIDDLIVWAHRPELFKDEPRIEHDVEYTFDPDEINWDDLPELSTEDLAALERLGSPEEFIGRLMAEADRRAREETP